MSTIWSSRSLKHSTKATISHYCNFSRSQWGIDSGGTTWNTKQHKNAEIIDKRKQFHAICGLRAVSSIYGFSSAHYRKISTLFFSSPCKVDIHRKTRTIGDLLRFALWFLLRHSTTWIFRLLKFRDVYVSTKTSEMEMEPEATSSRKQGTHIEKSKPNALLCQLYK